MFQKMIAALLGVMLALSMAACSTHADGEPSNPAGTTTAPAVTTTAPVATTTAPTASSMNKTEFEEIVLVENDDVFFKITGVEEDALWGYTLKVFIENKTGKELMFTVRDVSVNGFMCDPYWAVSVAAGKKSNSSISWSETAFEENGIEQVQDITLTLQAYDSNDFMAEDVLKETFVVHP